MQSCWQRSLTLPAGLFLLHRKLRSLSQSFLFYTRLCHGQGIQNVLQLIFFHDPLLQYQITDGFAGCQCLFCNFSSLLVTDVGTECSDYPHTALHQLTAPLSIRRYARHTVIHKGLYRIGKSINGLKQIIN